jgi:hypothetical protein
MTRLTIHADHHEILIVNKPWVIIGSGATDHGLPDRVQVAALLLIHTVWIATRLV